MSLLIYRNILYLLFLSPAWAGSPEPIRDITWTKDSVQQRIIEQVLLFPQEKLYVHTDRSQYVSGERIWFRAYLLDAVLHTPSIRDTYVYVEMISPADSVIARVLVNRNGGAFSGHLDLQPGMADGEYFLRAYTHKGQHPPSPHAPAPNRAGSRHLAIPEDHANPVFLRKINVLGTRRPPQQAGISQNYGLSVSFYPEGGYLVQGINNRVAFKALYPDGSPAVIKGRIIDQDGMDHGPAETLHHGMGRFDLTPGTGRQYALVIEDTQGKETGERKEFVLPAADPDAIALRAQLADGDLRVALSRSPGNALRSPLYLLLHTRGMVHYMEAWDDDYEGIAFDTADFPSGILQILILDAQANPLSERLVFCQNDKEAALAFSTDKPDYGARGLVKASVLLTEGTGRPLPGSFSVSVTDDRDVSPDNGQNILATMLLGSELRGNIPDPAFYIREENQQEMDILMMTHGWRRYDIPAVVQGRYERPPDAGAHGLAIRGTVRAGGIRNRPVEKSPVSIFSWQTDYIDQTSTDSLGRFAFEGIEFADSLTFVIQAVSPAGRNSPDLYVDQERFPLVPESYSAFRGRGHAHPSTADSPQLSARQNGLLEKSMRRISQGVQRGIEIEEVTVEAQRNQPAESFSYYMPRDGRNVLTPEKLEEIQPMNLSDALKYIPFITIEQGQVFINQMRNNSLTPVPAVLIIDDIIVSNVDNIDNIIDPSNIERVGVLRGAGATLLGGQGAGGAIVITTRKGLSTSGLQARQQQNIRIVNPLGLQDPAEFYSPLYETEGQRDREDPDLRTTIYWNPNVNISSEGEARFDFYAADNKTTYSVVIEGVADNGQLIRQVAKITVK